MNRRLLVILIIMIAAVISLAVFMGKGHRKSAKVTKSTNVTAPVSSSAGALLARAKDFEAKGNLWEAKLVYQQLIAAYANSPEVMDWQKKSEELNMGLLFSPAITPKSVSYEIKHGDTLTKIAKEFKTTTQLIMKSNHLSDDKIVPGRKIKVWNTPFSILVDKSQNILMLKSGEEILKTYIVSTGVNNSTPVGTYKINNKLVNPTWFKAGAVVAPGSADNLLGTRWLGFDLPGYGIHGTIDPQSLGKQVTQGCVRMANSEVEELYSIVPTGIEVTIVD
ncbi:MAG: L,D-transpeptidase family protein [Candidatus Omnitrophica bacterium]|nr:L,D-transpeptidase family protein [Candidatus Omnitrophota bacterium]